MVTVLGALPHPLEKLMTDGLELLVSARAN
jgi:hypothetical protein